MIQKTRHEIIGQSLQDQKYPSYVPKVFREDFLRKLADEGYAVFIDAGSDLESLLAIKDAGSRLILLPKTFHIPTEKERSLIKDPSQKAYLEAHRKSAVVHYLELMWDTFSDEQKRIAENAIQKKSGMFLNKHILTALQILPEDILYTLPADIKDPKIGIALRNLHNGYISNTWISSVDGMLLFLDDRVRRMGGCSPRIRFVRKYAETSTYAVDGKDAVYEVDIFNTPVGKQGSRDNYALPWFMFAQCTCEDWKYGSIYHKKSRVRQSKLCKHINAVVWYEISRLNNSPGLRWYGRILPVLRKEQFFLLKALSERSLVSDEQGNFRPLTKTEIEKIIGMDIGRLGSYSKGVYYRKEQRQENPLEYL